MFLMLVFLKLPCNVLFWEAVRSEVDTCCREISRSSSNNDPRIPDTILPLPFLIAHAGGFLGLFYLSNEVPYTTRLRRLPYFYFYLEMCWYSFVFNLVRVATFWAERWWRWSRSRCFAGPTTSARKSRPWFETRSTWWASWTTGMLISLLTKSINGS